MHMLNLIRSSRPNLFDTITAPIALANDDYLAEYLDGFAHVSSPDCLIDTEIYALETFGICDAFDAGVRAGILAAFGLPDSLPQLAEGLGLV